MLNVGTPELLVILVVALLVLGPTRLPEVARQIGKAVGEVRRLSAGFQAEMRDAMQEPVKLEPAEPAEAADPEPGPAAADAQAAPADPGQAPTAGGSTVAGEPADGGTSATSPVDPEVPGDETPASGPDAA